MGGKRRHQPQKRVLIATFVSGMLFFWVGMKVWQSRSFAALPSVLDNYQDLYVLHSLESHMDLILHLETNGP